MEGCFCEMVVLRLLLREGETGGRPAALLLLLLLLALVLVRAVLNDMTAFA